MPEKHLLLIRPEPQSQALAKSVAAQAKSELALIISPILKIEPVPITQSTLNAQFLLFTSVNGVQTWAAHTSDRSIPALCVGKSTTQEAINAGFNAQSADGTGQDLLQLSLKSAHVSKGPLYHISGLKTAFDLAEHLTAHGFKAKRVISYKQQERLLSSSALDCLKNESVIVPIFSPHSAKVFAKQTTNTPLKNADLVCISRNAAKPLMGVKGRISIAQNPTREAMIDAIVARTQS